MKYKNWYLSVNIFIGKITRAYSQNVSKTTNVVQIPIWPSIEASLGSFMYQIPTYMCGHFGIPYVTLFEAIFWTIIQFRNSSEFRTESFVSSLVFIFFYLNKILSNCRLWLSLEPVEECGKYMSGHPSHSSLFSDHIPEKHGALPAKGDIHKCYEKV